MDTAVQDDSFAIVKAGESLFAIPALSVQTMVILPRVFKVPRTSPYVRGVINLRGHVLPLVDLRLRCGMEPLSKQAEDLCQLLEQREQDHRKWLTELEKSVTERRSFTLTTDPHKCAFGKWYDHYRTDDLVLEMLLKRFDEPHKAIHAVAEQVERLKAAEDFGAACALIEKTRKGTLSGLISLFATCREHVRTRAREVGVVIEAGGARFALAVDSVESTEHLEPASETEIQTAMTQQCRALVRGVAKRKRGQQVVLLLNTDSNLLS